jgi:ribose-phosphate pyrophosphokinase
MNKNISDIKIFAGSSSINFLNKMCEYLDIIPGKSESFHFSEGNSYVKIQENVREKDIYIVQTIGLNANDSLVELLFWIDAFKRSSANSVTVIIPFISYAKGDKKDEPRVSIRARVCADCLETAGADRIITMDLHSPQIQGFFKIPVDHLFAYPLLCEYIKSLSIPDLVIVSPDAGFAKSARRFSSYLNLPTVICDKTRSDHSEKVEILEIIGNVKDKNVFIVDDFTITGSTLTETALVLRENGAKTINALVSHALLTEKGLANIENSEIDTLVITDTVYNPLAFINKKIKTISVTSLFAEAVRIIHDKESLSALFDHLPKKVLDFAIN